MFFDIKITIVYNMLTIYNLTIRPVSMCEQVKSWTCEAFNANKLFTFTVFDVVFI